MHSPDIYFSFWKK